MLRRVVPDHSHGTGTDFRRVTTGTWHDSILSRNGASGKSGPIHLELTRFRGEPAEDGRRGLRHVQRPQSWLKAMIHRRRRPLEIVLVTRLGIVLVNGGSRFPPDATAHQSSRPTPCVLVSLRCQGAIVRTPDLDAVIGRCHASVARVTVIALSILPHVPNSPRPSSIPGA